MHRGVDGLAKLGGMGPHIASLIRHSEGQIKVIRKTDTHVKLSRVDV